VTGRQEGDDQPAVLDRLHCPIPRANAQLATGIPLDHHLIPLSNSCHAGEYADVRACTSSIGTAYSVLTALTRRMFALTAYRRLTDG